MREIVIFGASDQAEMAYFYFKHDSAFNPVAFTVHEEYIKETTFAGLPLIAFGKITSSYPPNQFDMFVAIGYSKLNKVRERICKEAKAKGYKLVSYVSSKATIWPELSYGENCFILEQNNIQPFVRIGNNVTLWSGNHIGHHSVIEDNCFITSHVVISGRSRIGQNCFLGVNASIKDHVVIAKECVIGAGALITADTEEGGVYVSQSSQRSKVPSNRLRGL